MATTISASFTAVGSTTGLLVVEGQSATYTASGTYAATIVLERTRDGGQTWTEITSNSWRCSSYTSGTVVVGVTALAFAFTVPIRNAAGEVVFGVTSDGTIAKRRVVAQTDAATVTVNADVTDLAALATLSQATDFANPSGTPTDGQLLEIRVLHVVIGDGRDPGDLVRHPGGHLRQQVPRHLGRAADRDHRRRRAGSLVVRVDRRLVEVGRHRLHPSGVRARP